MRLGVIRAGNEPSQVEPDLARLNSIKIKSAQYSTRFKLTNNSVRLDSSNQMNQKKNKKKCMPNQKPNTIIF